MVLPSDRTKSAYTGSAHLTPALGLSLSVRALECSSNLGTSELGEKDTPTSIKAMH